MRLKHNKKRNTAFIYEALIRSLTESIVRKNKNRQNKIVSLLKEYFVVGQPLQEELQLYKAIYETRGVSPRIAEKMLWEAKEAYNALDKTCIFKEQSALIKKINKSLSPSLFNSFVSNYRSLASIYSIFNDKTVTKDRVILEEKLVESMAESINESDTLRPIDSIVYKSFVEKFNGHYGEGLLDEQKELLNKYISSFADNALELKIFLNEEIGRLRENLQSAKFDEDIVADTEMVSKVESVIGVLDDVKEREISEDTLVSVLKVQQLASELTA